MLLQGIRNRQQTGTDTLHPRQAEFLAQDCEELMFGGALGGGKTEILLRWLAEGVQYPEFSGLFVRRTHPQLEGSPTAPVERSRRFFQPLGGVYDWSKHVWKFENGAMVKFAHCQHEKDKHNFDGHEYHRVAVDQVEQLTETQYQYLFSRMRRTEGFPIPCGIRSAANPIGGHWVRQRFVTEEAIRTLKAYTAYDPSPPGMIFDTPCGAKFMPSRVADNPSLKLDEYIERLQTKLGAVLAARLANGDWSVVEGAIIDPEFLRYYTVRGEILLPQKAGGGIDCRTCQRFATIDTAGTSKQKADEAKGKPPSWSVCAVWDWWAQPRLLFLRHVWRARVDWFGLKKGVADTLAAWSVPMALIEMAHHGQPLADELPFSTRMVRPVIAGMKEAHAGPGLGAKHERAIASGLLNMIEKGQVILPDVQTVPDVHAWMPDFESELITWSGHPDDPADQIDVCSYAANHVKSSSLSWGGVVNVG